MAFAISQLCQAETTTDSKASTAALVFDCLLVAAMVSVVCLLVIGEIDLGLGAVGTFSNPCVQALLCASGAIVVLDLLVFLRKSCVSAPVQIPKPKPLQIPPARTLKPKAAVAVVQTKPQPEGAVVNRCLQKSMDVQLDDSSWHDQGEIADGLSGESPRVKDASSAREQTDASDGFVQQQGVLREESSAVLIQEGYEKLNKEGKRLFQKALSSRSGIISSVWCVDNLEMVADESACRGDTLTITIDLAVDSSGNYFFKFPESAICLSPGNAETDIQLLASRIKEKIEVAKET